MKPGSIRHKHLQPDQGKLDRARRILGSQNGTDALDRAPSIVVSEADIDTTVGKCAVEAAFKSVDPLGLGVTFLRAVVTGA